jgi:phage shock protein C
MTVVLAVLLLCLVGALLGLALRALGVVGKRSGLQRPREGRAIAGVCAALARRTSLSVHQIRVLFVVSVVLPGSQVVLYVVLWAFIPSAPRSAVAGVPQP